MSICLQIASEQFWNDINEYCRHCGLSGGVYLIQSLRKGSPVPISRLLGIDEQGVLYIGKADSFLDRVISLKKSTSNYYRGTGHEFGCRYKENPRILEQFPFESLFAVIEPSNDPKGFERLRLTAYIAAFGELPPLNRHR